MAEHDISLVTAKAGSVVAENMKVSLATAAGGLTPSTITAMVGIHKGEALTLAPTVTGAMSNMDTQYTALITANTAPSLALAARITSAKANLIALQSSLGVTGTPVSSDLGNFGSILNQAQGHISDSTELKKATDFISNTSFSDYGTGITNMSSMATQGLDGALGDLGGASKAFEAAGPVFDLKDMSKFGTSSGLIDKLNTVKLGNASGVNGAIAAAGLDINMPEHSAQVDKVMASITDPKVLSTVIEQLGINPPGGVATSFSSRVKPLGYALDGTALYGTNPGLPAVGGINYLKDLTDLTKLANPSDVAGLTGGLSAMSSKFSDMGAKFTSPAAAASMLKGIEIPSIPNLEAAAPSLSGLMSGMSADIGNMTGTASGLSALNGANGLPNITDFTHAVSGGPELAAINAAGAITDEQITALEDSLVKSQNLIESAGIDLAVPPMPSLGSAMSFATSLHKIGADTSGSGITDALKNMANTASASGDAIKASLAEGKNKALMMAQGIPPLKFGS